MADDAGVVATEGDETHSLLIAALVGAAIGAGIGLLASQALDDDDRVTRLVRATRRGAGRQMRRGASAASTLGSAASGALGDARDTVGDFATRAREAFDEALEREVKQLRRAARRQRRRLGF